MTSESILQPFCGRCGGVGSIATWTGPKGNGGKVGPCPRCQPVELVRAFVTTLNPFTRRKDNGRA